MRQVIVSGTTNALHETSTEYSSITFHNNYTWFGTEANRQEMSPGSFKITGLHVQLTTAPGAGNSRDFTVRLNAADTAVTVTISGTDTEAFIVDQDVAVVATDKLALKTVPTSSPTEADAIWTVTFETEGDGETHIINGQFDLLNGAIPDEINHLMGGSNWSVTGIGSVNKDQVMPLAGVFSDLYVELDGTAGPTGSDGYVFTLGSDGTDTGISVAILNGSTTGNDTTNTLTVAKGDFVHLISTTRGNPTNRRVKWGIVFNADEADKFPIMGGSTNSLNATTTEYNYLSSANINWHATQTERTQLTQCMRLSNLYIELGQAPGAGNDYEFTIMKNGVATDLTVQISDVSVRGNNTTDVIEFDEFDTVSIRCVPTSSPAVTDVTWSVAGESMFPFPNSLMMVGHGR